MDKINLIPLEHRYKMPFKIFLVGTLGIFFLATVFYIINIKQVTLSELEFKLSEVKQKKQELNYDRFVESEQIASKLSRLIEVKEQISLIKSPYWQDLLVLTNLAIPDEVTISRIIIEGNDGILVELISNGLIAGAEYLAQVRQQDKYREVRLLKGNKIGYDERYMLELLIVREE